MGTKYTKHFTTKATPQSEPITGAKGTPQVKNSAGGFSFAIDDWKRLDRFLILGAEGGSYYATEKKLTRENAKAIERLLKVDGLRVVARIVEISDAGRAPKNDPALFALAMAAKLGDDATRKAANEALPRVARIGTHLQHYADYVQAFGGWGRGTRTAVAKWYTAKDAGKLAYQLVKYQSRDGWSHRDMLRLAHAKAPSVGHAALFAWATKGKEGLEKFRDETTGARLYPADLFEQEQKVAAHKREIADVANATRLITGFEMAKTETDLKKVVKIVVDYKLPREAIPTEALKLPEVWEAMLPDMGMTALIRNLATMTRIGYLKQMNYACQDVVKRLGDFEEIKKGRVHPLQILAALTTYQSGQSARGSSSWTPVQAIVDALDKAFYASFQTVEPTGKRTMLALDVSSSMNGGEISGIPGLTPRVGSAAMALITAAVEPNHMFTGFTSGSGGRFRAGDGLSVLKISARQRLDDVVNYVDRLGFGGTDCALPMTWALANKTPIDTFVIYTDSETWAGGIHPTQALKEYRQKMGIGAKLVVVGMVSNGFTIADPDDAGMLDCVGMDLTTPQVIASFSVE